MTCEIDHTAGLPKKQNDESRGFAELASGVPQVRGLVRTELGRRDAGAAEQRLRERVQQLMEENTRLKSQLAGR